MIEYLRDRYNEELSRYTTIEEKCTKLLTVISILIALLTAIGAIDNGAIFKPRSPSSAVVLFLYICAALGIGWTWIETLNAFNTKPNTVATKNKQAIDHMCISNHEESLNYILTIYRDALPEMSQEINSKASIISNAHRSLIVCSGFLAVAFLVHFFSSYTALT